MCTISDRTKKVAHISSRNLQPCNVVLIAYKNTLRGEYRLGLVKDVFPGIDGRVRKVSVTYKKYKVDEKTYKYSGSPDTVATRALGPGR